MLVPRMLTAAEVATAAGKIVGNVLHTGRVHGSLGPDNLALIRSLATRFGGDVP